MIDLNHADPQQTADPIMSSWGKPPATGRAAGNQAHGTPDDTSTISISRITSVTDNKPVPFVTAWSAFVNDCQTPDVRGTLALDQYLASEKSIRDRQKDGAAIIAGTYSRLDTRNQGDLISLSLVTLDIDESHYTFDALCDRLEGFEAIVHTSYSHSIDKPKYRAFILLQQPITSEIKPTLERIIDFFDDRIGHIDPASRKPGQLFFTPACPPGGEALYQFRHLSGIPLDPLDFPAPPAKDQAKPERTTGTKPGDDYNSRASWSDLLEPLGWSPFFRNHYSRPGKQRGISGSILDAGFYCHTSAPEAQPFECGKSYSLFGAYALVNHAGDYQEAARELSRLGYGDKRQVDPLSPPAPDTGTTTETPGEQWPELLPLPEGLPPVKTLEPALIPAPLRGWLMDIADRMQIPPDFSTAAAVVALGIIIGRGCGIHPKRHDDWLVIPNLWGAVIGRPSLMKTPAITEAQRHLVRLETEAREAYQESSQLQEIDQEINKITQAAICEGIKKAVKSGDTGAIEAAKARLANLDREAPATRRRYQTQDGTTEKIGELLNQNPRGMLINRDELIGWFHSLDKGGREGDRAFYLEAWNGTRGYTYDRIGRGTLDIDALCVSIFGAITPGPLSDYVYQASRGGNGDDGLLQRFQVMVWPDVPKDWRNVDRFPDTTEKNRACEIFRLLTGDIPGAVKEDGADLPALRFTPAAQDIFDTWRHELETRLRSDHGLPPSLESHLAKYRSLMPSLALIFHLVEVADGSTAAGPVSERAALMAAAWCQYLESHAGRVYGGATMPGMESAREIVKHIRRGAIHDGMTVRELWRPQWSRLTNSEEVKAGLNVLAEYDWLTLDRITTGGRPSENIRLNPKIKV